ncbi:nicotinate (nicotinamide) nucleotide adenylyltransferase [Psychromonas sp. CNPT3]|uniref:nicotinate-nucleotide adenylyltransferase n=1 Tax=Psychromonas sp. CNPT3 TaxID=314282 RepID=UPI00006E4424|nr:nicotinate-nucleotide adenylyltransferase [Psychromonas sp. CNPT3]AGH80687.1 nicotinate (nicotinamide) nucleotide adenylyltransferase [Psychromonas sp. CNPT3]
MPLSDPKVTSIVKQQAIGFLGGTFDPIHFGHLRPALEVCERVNLQTLFLLPNHIAPHKSSAQCSATRRAHMVRLAIKAQPKLRIDTRELNRAQASYTIDTLKELKQDYPHTPICFIMGMDSLLSFDSWHQWQDILNYCHLIVCHRPGWKCDFNNKISALLKAHKTSHKDDLHCLQAGKIYFQETTQLEVSSSQIRDALQQHRSIDYLLPNSVIDYIKTQQLYKNTPD